ncbi:MAG: RING-HC finger protein [Candidatus Endonucleobacter sp. (ex Gigantidas childressi)]|nr:RING-HC finger protein [Candidatus Endonucleobacter sp. (ex Gigantidas childressi)]
MKRSLSKMMFYAFIIFFIPQRGMAMLDSIDQNMPDHWVPIKKNIKIIVPITLPESEIGAMVDLKVENSVTNGLTELYRFVYEDSDNQEETQKTELSKKIDTINKDNKYPVIVNSIDNEQYCHLVIKQPGQECLELYTLDTKLTKSSACVQNTFLSKEILPSIALKKNIITEDRADGLFDIKHCSKELLKKYHPTLIENNKDTCFILYISCHLKEAGANDDSCPLYAAFLFIKKNSDSFDPFCRLNIQDDSNDIDEDGGAEGGDTLYSQRVSGTTIDILQDGRVRLNCGGKCNIECRPAVSIQSAWWTYAIDHMKAYKYKSCFIDHNSDKPYAFAVYMSMNETISAQGCKQFLECPPSTDVLSKITSKEISDIAQATRTILDIATKEEPKRVANEKEAQRVANEKEAQRLANEEEAQRLANEKEAQRVADEKEAQRLAGLEAQRLAGLEAQRLANDQARIQMERMQHTATSAERVSAEHRASFKYPEFTTYEARLSSYVNWPRQDKQAPESLADAGYFYTGVEDIVRCFCCDLGMAEWSGNERPWQEHARHSSYCWFLKRSKGQEYIDEVRTRWKKVYDPKHKFFENKQNRLNSFRQWRTDVSQTPEMLADAGFYHIAAEDDTVRCHYCDGGLRNWERGDDPWEVHAKYFGFCRFLIKIKGLDYINGIQNAARQRALAENMEAQQAQQITGGNRSRSSETASSSANIWRVQNEPVETENPNMEQLEEENKKLKKLMECIKCRNNKAAMLFKECGHRVLCEPCSKKVKKCPVPKCDKTISKQPVKTYLS